jgi:geranylgeranyl pyrophosphate synthase
LPNSSSATGPSAEKLAQIFGEAWSTQRESYASIPGELGKALVYAMDGAGKLVRPKFTLLAASAVDPDWNASGQENAWKRALVIASAMAIEMVHTYSLIHDDLPCMDDDDLRRGRPTLHKVHGEATALLAGDALLTDAFQALAGVFSRESLPPAAGFAGLACVSELASAAGSRGMVLGQMLDLANVGSITKRELEKVHELKTGALLGASCAMGATAAGGGTAVVEAFRKAGSDLGIAFQVMDDLLDNSPNTGKSKGKDAESGKQTYLSLLGYDQGMALVESLTNRALQGLDDQSVLTPAFREFAVGLCRRES